MASQCVNCGIKLEQCIKRHLMTDECETMRILLSDWTSKELDENDAVCEQCHYSMQQALETNYTIRKFGHLDLCLSCGESIKDKQSHNLNDHLEEKLAIVQWIQPHQVKHLENVCHKCWCKADRIVKKKSAIEYEMVDEKRLKIEPQTENSDPLAEEEIYVPPPLPENDIQLRINRPSTPTISMEKYRRADDAPDKCFFENCDQTERLKVPKILKERLLIEHSFYVPRHARICDYHLNTVHSEWCELYSSSLLSDFTVDQLENLCALLKSSTGRYHWSRNAFQSLIRTKPVLCTYWLGVNYKEFESMLKKLEPLKFKFAKKSLAMYLMKRHTGFDDERIASFFKRSVKLVQNNICAVRDYLGSIETNYQSAEIEETHIVVKKKNR